MTTDHDAVEPWAAVGELGGFFDTPPEFLAPGDAASLLREEARLLAEEKRKESERADRSDVRQTAAMMQARQRALAKGLPWSPERPFEHEPTVLQKADMMFAAMDAQARRDDLVAAKEAGLVHLLHQSPHPVEPAGAPALRSQGVATSGMATSGPVAATHPVPLAVDHLADQSAAAKARRALRRWSADRRARARKERT